MPRHHNPAKKRAEAEAVRQRVSRASVHTYFYFFAVTAVITVGLGNALLFANRLYVGTTKTGDVRLYPATVIWFMMAGLIGFCVAFLTCENIHRFLLGPPPSILSVEYEFANGPIPPFLKRTYVAAAVILSLIAILNIRKHAVIKGSEIIEQRALAFSVSRYRCTDISRITMSRYFIPASKSSQARISASRSLFVWLRSGKRWSLKDSELFAAKPERVAEYLAERCSVTVEYPEMVLDMPNPAQVAKRGQRMLLVCCFTMALLMGLWVLAEVRRG